VFSFSAPSGACVPHTVFGEGQAWGACGWILNQRTNESVGPSTNQWYIAAPLPTGSCGGVYTYTLGVTYNSITSTQAVSFTVSGPTPTPPPTGVEQVAIDYSYDPLYRLTRATYSGSLAASYAYSYDAVGNRLTQDANGTRTTYSYDNANRLTSVNGQAYTWDNNGNLVSDGLLTYSYDQANRLKQVTQGANTYTFAYNGVGDRLSQTVGITTTRYLLDPGAGLTQVLADGTNTYLYGNGRLAQYQAEMQYFGADGLGSVRQLYDASGMVAANTRYDPYGNLISQSGEATSVFGYTGEQWDAATGLEYLRARYYSSAQGRFITEDTAAGNDTLPQSLHLYSYAWDNPISLADPSGQQVAPPLVCTPGQPCPTGLLSVEQINAVKGLLSMIAPRAPTSDWTAEAQKNLRAVQEERKIYQALSDPTLITAFDITRGQYEKRDALLEIWFESHCDYDPLYDYAIEQWFAWQGWDPYALKLYIGTRWGWWKYKRNPGDLAGIQGIVAGVAFVGAQDEANKLGNLGVQMPWTKVTKANGLTAWTEQLYEKMKVNKALTLTKEQADILVSRARTYAVQLNLEPGHTGDPKWNMPHLHIGDERYHVRVPNNCVLPPP
jgi:RHS repeat-associated protein